MGPNSVRSVPADQSGGCGGYFLSSWSLSINSRKHRAASQEGLIRGLTVRTQWSFQKVKHFLCSSLKYLAYIKIAQVCRKLLVLSKRRLWVKLLDLPPCVVSVYSSFLPLPKGIHCKLNGWICYAPIKSAKYNSPPVLWTF